MSNGVNKERGNRSALSKREVPREPCPHILHFHQGEHVHYFNQYFATVEDDEEYLCWSHWIMAIIMLKH